MGRHFVGRRLAYACGVLLLDLPAHAQPLDFTPSTWTTTTGARAAISVDLNRDGRLDVVTANTGRNTIAILLNRGNGAGFFAPREVPVGAGPFDLTSGDLNRDGVPDLVVTTPDARAIEVLLVGPGGTVASRRVFGLASESRGVALADITRDGVLDLVLSIYDRHLVSIWPGIGDGSFFSDIGDIPVGTHPQDVVATDFNHDGLIDVAVASAGSATLDVLSGKADGTFTRRAVAAGRALNVLLAVDLNRDGWLDLAAAATSTSVVAIFRGGASGFALAGTRAAGSSPRGIATADFNHDGRPDLVTGNLLANSASVFLGRADGSMLPDWVEDLPAGAGARAVATGDFDNDGRIDLAIAAQSSAQLWLYDNSTAFIPPAFSFRTAPTGAQQTDVVAVDFNENGITDLLYGHSVLLDGTSTVNLPIEPRANVTHVAAGDYNRDGHADAVFGSYTCCGTPARDQLTLHLGNGRGQFAAPIVLETRYISQLQLADIDRDGTLDMLGRTLDRLLYVSRQTAEGRVVTTLSLGGGVSLFELGDVNRDGIVDVVAVHQNPQRIAVHLGDGAGGFQSTTILVSNAVESTSLGDMNHDGRLDIVFAAGDRVGIMLAGNGGAWSGPAYYPTPRYGEAVAPILADLNMDGHLDVFTWSGAMFTGNGDGTLDAAIGFDINAYVGIALDWNRDGLIDIVTSGGAFINERRTVNRPPVANAGGDMTFRYYQQFEQEDGSLSAFYSFDPDLHRLSYEWRDETGQLIGNDVWAVFPPQFPGTYAFTLTVRDGRGGEDTDQIDVTILNEPEIVLHTRQTWPNGIWEAVADSTAASEERMFYPNANAPKVPAPSADPTSYFDVWFAPDPTLTYKLWVRLKAQDNYWGNDSVWVQFSGAVNASGQPAYRIGSTSGLPINLEECANCGVAGWGWEDDGWGAPNVNGALLRFPDGGGQQIRIQVREDGVSVDQIVLSAVKYRSARPGAAKNDTLILPTTQRPPE